MRWRWAINKQVIGEANQRRVAFHCLSSLPIFTPPHLCFASKLQALIYIHHSRRTMRMTAAAVAVLAALWVIMGCNGESMSRVIGMGLESWEEEMMEMNMMVEMSGREDLVEAAGYGEEKLSKVSVTGKVVCHHHAQQPPHPVSGASVAIFCERSRKNHRKHDQKPEKCSATGSAGEDGDFVIEVPSHLHAIPNLQDVCLLKVIHLPTHSKCQPGFRPKHQDIQLHSVDEGGARTYTASTINLILTAAAEKTTTSESKHSKARRYSTKNNRKRMHSHHHSY